MGGEQVGLSASHRACHALGAAGGKVGELEMNDGQVPDSRVDGK